MNKSSRRTLRLDEEETSNIEEEEGSVEMVELEQEVQISNNQLANMMTNLSKKFAEMEEKLVTVNSNAKTFKEKMG